MPSNQWAIYVVTAALAVMAALPNAVSQPQTLAQRCEPEPGRVIQCIKPSETDPAIRRFDSAHYVLFNANSSPQADLLVFLPGTGAKPPGPVPFLKAAADAGYRVISLAYNDVPAVAVYCPRKPDPACSENFRRMRIYGDETTIDRAIDNSKAESVINRLVKLLEYLKRHDPGRNWGDYLEDGTLNWNRIAFTGQSQGAGMAAFIAKEHLVARVVLFSSPWDFVVSKGSVRRLAAWISQPSKTPPERWFGGYHQRENMAGLIAQAYSELRIPGSHIRIFTLDLPATRQQTASKNPFHGEGVRNPAYAKQRAFFLGDSP
jgi:predicted esterase